MSRKSKRTTDVVYERPELRERLLNPRRLSLWVLGIAGWIFASALILAFLQLGSFAGVLATTGAGIILALLFTAVVKPSTHQIAVSAEDLTVTTRRGDHVYPWIGTQALTVQTSRFTNVHDLAILNGKKNSDDVVVRADKETWGALVANLSKSAKAHGISLTEK